MVQPEIRKGTDVPFHRRFKRQNLFDEPDGKRYAKWFAPRRSNHTQNTEHDIQNTYRKQYQKTNQNNAKNPPNDGSNKHGDRPIKRLLTLIRQITVLGFNQINNECWNEAKKYSA